MGAAAGLAAVSAASGGAAAPATGVVIERASRHQYPGIERAGVLLISHTYNAYSMATLLLAPGLDEPETNEALTSQNMAERKEKACAVLN